jgi:hypothetical protein
MGSGPYPLKPQSVILITNNITAHLSVIIVMSALTDDDGVCECCADTDLLAVGFVFQVGAPDTAAHVGGDVRERGAVHVRVVVRHPCHRNVFEVDGLAGASAAVFHVIHRAQVGHSLQVHELHELR